jgi:hypothetical protein
LVQLAVILVGGLVLVLLLWKAGCLNLRALAVAFQPYRARALMTGNEREFFGRLVAALPEHHVFPQVAMSALMDTKVGLVAGARRGARNRFSQKVIDYVVADRASLQVVALVELDDRTHDPKRDAARDKLTRSVGLRTVRFSAKNRPDVREIRLHVLQGVQ